MDNNQIIKMALKHAVNFIYENGWNLNNDDSMKILGCNENEIARFFLNEAINKLENNLK